MTADLGDLAVAERDPEAAVPGSDDVVDLLFVDAALFEGDHIGGFCCLVHVGTCVEEGPTHDLAVLIDDDGLCLG